MWVRSQIKELRGKKNEGSPDQPFHFIDEKAGLNPTIRNDYWLE